jgi:hypothetical protein
MDSVSDNEIIYRCVFHGRNLYRTKNGQLQISSQAFADRNQMPSVDRALLRNHQPSQTQKSSDDGVLSLVVLDVRQIDTVRQLDAKGNLVQQHKIDVVPDPTIGKVGEADNPAHAEIRPTPAYQTKSVFKKLQESLAKLATERIEQKGWEILPSDLRS